MERACEAAVDAACSSEAAEQEPGSRASVLVCGRSVFDVPEVEVSKKALDRRVLLSSDGSAGYGGAEFKSGVLRIDSVPMKLLSKWRKLWSFLPQELQDQIQMDEISTFSVTEPLSAERIALELMQLEGLSGESIITDATACVGGNAIAFTRFFHHVHAIELDDGRCKMLQNNFNVCLAHMQPHCHGCQRYQGFCDCQKHPDERFASPKIGTLEIHQGDCLEICPKLQQDVIFVDPPWGGSEYHKRERVSLFLSKTPLAKVCALLGEHSQYVAMKIPHNADLSEFEADPKCIMVKNVKIVKRLRLLVVKFEVEQRALSHEELEFLKGIGLKLS